MATTNLQLWASDYRHNSVTIKEDGDTLLVKFKDDAEFRPPTAEERRAIDIEQTAIRLWDRECYCCDSMLVSDHIQNAYDLPKELRQNWILEENTTNLQTTPDEWTIEECRDWLEERGIAFPDPNPFAMDRPTLLDELGVEEEDDEHHQMSDEDLRKELIEEMDSETSEGLDNWRNKVRDNAETAEVYEWWRVSEWFASKLAEVGEVVLENGYGQWWGRCCTGQSVLMDGTIQKVAVLVVDG